MNKWNWAAVAVGLATWGSCGAFAADITRIQGDATVTHLGASHAAAMGDALSEGDEVSTSPDGEVLLTVDEEGRLLVRPDSVLSFEEIRMDTRIKRQRMSVRVVRGGLRYVSGHIGGHAVKFEIGTYTIGLRGTDIDLVLAGPNSQVEAGTYLRVNAGEAEMVAKDGSSLVVRPNEVGQSLEASQATRSFVPRPPFIKLLKPPATVFRRDDFDSLLQ